jgi:hypothetical protein
MNTESRDRGSVTESKGAGWKWIPQQGVYLWWDGERYTAQADWDGAQWEVGAVETITPTERVRPASFPARAMMSLLVVAGCAALFWGGYVYGQNPASSYPVEMWEYYCADENIDLIAEGLWVPWLVLVVVGGAIVVTWRRLGPNDRWLRIPAICALIALVVTCPIVALFVQSANCAS